MKPHAVLFLAIGVLLAGCNDAVVPQCPSAAVLSDTDTLTVFRAGAPRDLSGEAYTAAIGNVRTDCYFPKAATFSTSTLGVGTHTITATYGGGGGYPASTSELGTVDVYSPTVAVAVSATQTYGGSPTFTATDPASLPPGVTVTGSLTGCTTSEDASAAPGTYPSTISGCSGLSLGGANAGSYTLAYVDSGVTVEALSLTVPVTGSQSYGGIPTFTAGPPTSLPTGITGVTGTLSGCGTTVGATTAPAATRPPSPAAGA